MLTLKQLAKKLSVHENTLYKLVNKKEIPHKRIGGKAIRFDEQEIENWIKRGEVNE